MVIFYTAVSYKIGISGGMEGMDLEYNLWFGDGLKKEIPEQFRLIFAINSDPLIFLGYQNHLCRSLGKIHRLAILPHSARR